MLTLTCTHMNMHTCITTYFPISLGYSTLLLFMYFYLLGRRREREKKKEKNTRYNIAKKMK